MPIIKGTLCSTLYRLTAEVCFPIALCRARMSASLIGPVCQAQSISVFGFSEQNVLVQFTLLYAVDSDRRSALHALVRRSGEPRFWTRFAAQQTFTASSGPSSTPERSILGFLPFSQSITTRAHSHALTATGS